MTFFTFCYYIFGIIDLYLVLILPIFNIPTKKNIIILHILYWATIPACISFFPNLSPYLALGLCFIYIFLLTKRNILAVCLSLFNYLLSIVLNYLVLSFLQATLGVSEHEVATQYYLAFYTFLTILLLFTSLALRRVYQHFIGNSLKLSLSSELLFLVYLGICALLFVYNYTYEASMGFPQELVRLNTLIFVVFFSITGIYIALLIHMFKKDARLQAQNIQYENLQQYTAQVEELYQNLRGFKHDYLNILATMDYYVANQDWDALTDYYETQISPTRSLLQNSYQDLGQLQKLEIAEIKSILYNKFVKAVELNIPINVEIRDTVSRLDADPVDIARVLGIYLDNAIDALTTPDYASDNKHLDVAILTDDSAVVIIVQNSCPDFPLQLQKLGTLNYSTKGTNRGMGLYLAAQTLRKYRNIQTTPSYREQTFTQTLKIYHTR